MRLVCLKRAPGSGWTYDRDGWASCVNWSPAWRAFGAELRVVTAEAAREAWGVYVP